MKLNDCSLEFLEYYKELIKKFSEETGVDFKPEFSNNFFTFLGTNYNLNYHVIKADKKLDEDEKKLKFSKAYEKSQKETAKKFLQEVMKADINILDDYEVIENDSTDLNQNNNNEKEEKTKRILKSFNIFMNKLSLAYLKDHNLPLNYNSDTMGGLSYKTLTGIFKKNDKTPITRIQEYEQTLSNVRPGDKSDRIREDLDRAMDDLNMINVNISDSKYQEIFDEAQETVKITSNIYDPNDKNLNRVQREVLNIEKVASIYTTLRDKYHNKNSVFTNWFTPTGWKESSKINEIRDKLMVKFGFTDRKAFNLFMDGISRKGSTNVKYFGDKARPIVQDYIKLAPSVLNEVNQKISTVEVEEHQENINKEVVKENKKEINNNIIEENNVQQIEVPIEDLGGYDENVINTNLTNPSVGKNEEERINDSDKNISNGFVVVDKKEVNTQILNDDETNIVNTEFYKDL